eukprot:scaffold202164_cov66-Cyclotella_meneghiniana.AAC.2
MGVTKGNLVLHKVSNLSLFDVAAIGRGIASAKGLEKPRIIADCSNIVYVLSKSSSVVSSVVNLLMKWASSGNVMVPACDGMVRPVCKQDTNRRNATKEISRINAFVLRKDIRQAKTRLLNDQLDQNERSSLEKSIATMERSCKTKETQATSKLPNNFVDELRRELSDSGAHSVIPATGGFVDQIAVAEFQADSYMSEQIVNNKAVMVMTRDSDIPILCGDDCIAIKEFTKDSFEIVCVSESTIRTAMSYIPSDSKAKFTPAQYPLFDGKESHRLRALMMVILGCDVYKSGMKGVGVPKLNELIKNIGDKTEDELYVELHDELSQKNNLTKDVVDTLVDALLYEPSNEASTTRTYIFDQPQSLPKYLEEFSVDEAFKGGSITPGPDIVTCKGVGDKTHLFLKACGTKNCCKCTCAVCTYCNGEIDKKVYCLACLASESVVPELGSIQSKSIAKMREELVNDRFDGANDLSPDEVEDAYEMLNFLEQYRKQANHSVPYPLYTTSEMDADRTDKWEEILDIDFKGGGAFLAEPELESKHVPGVMKFFAKLVLFREGKKTEWKKDHAVYDALPELFIKFADKSRVDSGFRLLARCVRHAFDTRTPKLNNKTAVLVLHNDDVGIHLRTGMPASMKKNIYESGIVATTNDVLSCKCTCQCGSQNEQRIVCVHNLAVLYLLTLLLFEDLAEHLLLEFAACLSADLWEVDKWSDNVMNDLRDSLVTLMSAAGEPVDKINDDCSLKDLLENFVVGTERRKAWKQRIKDPPKPSDLGPISEKLFKSTSKQAKTATMRCAKIEDQMPPTVTMATESNELTFTPNYVQVWSLIEAADCESVLESGYIGIELLSMRSDRQASGIDRLERTRMSKQARTDWSKLKSLSYKRSIRHIDVKLDNIPTRTRKEASTTTGITPKKRKHNAKSVVTPSPPKAATLCKNGQSLPLNDRPEKKQKISMRCRKCNNNNRDCPNLKFHCVTKYPEEIKAAKPSKDRVLRREGQILLRQEIMDRIGESRQSTKKLYVCDAHQFETVIKRRLVSYNGKKFVQRYRLTVPCGEGYASSLSQSKHVSKGTGSDRALRFILDDVTKNEVDNSLHAESQDLDELLHQLETDYKSLANDVDKVKNLEEQNLVREAKLEIERSNATQAMKAVQQIAEQTCEEHHIPMNTSLVQAAGMHLSQGNANKMTVTNKHFFHSDPIKKPDERKKAADYEPTVVLGMCDKEVKRRTGFSSEVALLSYVFVVCNGHIETIQKRNSSLTWYEEWFMVFEYVWGKSLTRLVDVEKEYCIRKHIVESIISAKVDIAFRCLNSWPIYASYDEDVSLRERKQKWKTKWSKKRPVCWDMTDIVAYGFTDANMQRITYSQYYGHNCFKGGIFTQFCGWQGNADLWTGAVSDSDYNRRAGYLQSQQQFQNEDLVETKNDDGQIDMKVLPFLNIYDKGYRAKMAAFKNGKQLVLQPDWADSDRTFNRYQTIGSASVASDRGGNERSVNVMKRPGYIRRGFQPNMCPIRFNKVWRTWGFQSNFMFVPIL